MEQILNYEQIPVGRATDYTGQQIGDYKIIYRIKNPEKPDSMHAYWLGQCQKCKKYEILNAPRLKAGIAQCNCIYDLTNKRFGRWLVLYKTKEHTKNGTPLWHCKCDCGNERDVNADCLRKGESQSCGCLNKEKAAERCRKARIDLTGQRFGKLVALYPIYSESKDAHTLWHCKCDCGNECDIDMGNLRSNKSQSCGCTLSAQEERIIKLLTENNIKFYYQYSFSDLLNKKFDFYIYEVDNKEQKYLIEFDGQQHFSFTNSGWDTEEHYIRTHKNDLLKNKYCFEKEIPLIRIPYNKNYTINDLKLDSTRFLLTPEKEESYYFI